MHSVKDKSEFAQAALALDSDFEELERLAGQIDRNELESDQDFEHVTRLLGRFAECGGRIGAGVQRLAQELEQARVRAEKAAELVGARSITVQQRREASQKMLESFQALALKARGLTESMQAVKSQDREALLESLPSINHELDVLSEDVARLEQDATAHGLKGLAKNAGAMRQSLQAARDKLRAS